MVFLGGLHRSGTSLLFGLLRDQPQISGFRDTGVPEDEGQHLQRVYPTAKAFGGEGRFGFAAGAHMVEAEPETARVEGTALFEQWSPHWDLDQPVLVEKSPPNLIRMRYLQAVFPTARFVVIVRHPVVVALATRKWSGASIRTMTRNWLAAHDELTDQAPHVRHLSIVRYEDLVREPEATLRGVFTAIGVQPIDVDADVVDTTERYLASRRWRERVQLLDLDRRFRPWGYTLSGVIDPTLDFLRHQTGVRESRPAPMGGSTCRS
jgi:hypothetical protein